jgi:hypothetical protein
MSKQTIRILKTTNSNLKPKKFMVRIEWDPLLCNSFELQDNVELAKTLLNWIKRFLSKTGGVICKPNFSQMEQFAMRKTPYCECVFNTRFSQETFINLYLRTPLEKFMQFFAISSTQPVIEKSHNARRSSRSSRSSTVGYQPRISVVLLLCSSRGIYTEVDSFDVTTKSDVERNVSRLEQFQSMSEDPSKEENHVDVDGDEEECDSVEVYVATSSDDQSHPPIPVIDTTVRPIHLLPAMTEAVHVVDHEDDDDEVTVSLSSSTSTSCDVESQSPTRVEESQRQISHQDSPIDSSSTSLGSAEPQFENMEVVTVDDIIDACRSTLVCQPIEERTLNASNDAEKLHNLFVVTPIVPAMEVEENPPVSSSSPSSPLPTLLSSSNSQPVTIQGPIEPSFGPTPPVLLPPTGADEEEKLRELEDMQTFDGNRTNVSESPMSAGFSTLSSSSSSSSFSPTSVSSTPEPSSGLSTPEPYSSEFMNRYREIQNGLTRYAYARAGHCPSVNFHNRGHRNVVDYSDVRY